MNCRVTPIPTRSTAGLLQLLHISGSRVGPEIPRPSVCSILPCRQWNQPPAYESLPLPDRRWADWLGYELAQQTMSTVHYTFATTFLLLLAHLKTPSNLLTLVNNFFTEFPEASSTPNTCSPWNPPFFSPPNIKKIITCILAFNA